MCPPSSSRKALRVWRNRKQARILYLSRTNQNVLCGTLPGARLRPTASPSSCLDRRSCCQLWLFHARSPSFRRSRKPPGVCHRIRLAKSLGIPPVFLLTGHGLPANLSMVPSVKRLGQETVKMTGTFNDLPILVLRQQVRPSVLNDRLQIVKTA
jgi:hypothetical protein